MAEEPKIDIGKLEAHFRDIDAIEQYGIEISPIYIDFEAFKRVGSHIIFVQKTIVEEAIKKWKNNKELNKFSSPLLNREKLFSWIPYCLLMNNKNDQAREIIDYIVENHIHTDVYVYAPDNLFWFFHDLGHGYLSQVLDNFYDNVYGKPEMLVNIFACIKMKQYKRFSRKKVEFEVIDRCYRYQKEDKEYFLRFLDSFDFSDDI